MKNNINILNALNESLEEEFKAKRKAKLKESEEHIDSFNGYSLYKIGKSTQPGYSIYKIINDETKEEKTVGLEDNRAVSFFRDDTKHAWKLEEEFKAKRKLKENENNSEYSIKSYHIEDMGGHTMALFGQFKNGLYFAGNEDGINIYDEDVWPYYEDYKKTETMDWEEYNKNHLIDTINPDIDIKIFNNIMKYTDFMDIEENLDEASNEDDYMLLDRLRSDCEYYLGAGNRNPKHLWAGNVKDQIDKMKEIYNSLKEKPEWLTMEDIENYEKRMTSDNLEEAQEFVITYIPDNNQKDKTASISVQGNNKQQATQQARQTIGNAAIVSIQPLVEDETIVIPNTEVETDYIINDVTVLDNVRDGDVQAPDMEALLTLIDESLKSKYSNEWGRIKTLSSSKNESYSYALVDISTPEVLKEFESKGITDVAIGKNLILENINGMYKFKVNNLNGTTKYSKVTTNPQQTIYEWIESEFLQEAKEEKAKEAEILKTKTEKETVENYIANRIDLRQEIENIKMFIDLSKQVKAQDEMKPSIQDRMYAFAAEMPQNIEIKNNDDKYELSFSNLDQVVEMIFGKEWVKEKEEIPEVVSPINESALPNISKFIYDLDKDKGNSWSAQHYTEDGNGNKIIIVTRNGNSDNSAEDIKKAVETKYPKLKGEITENKAGVWFYLTESQKLTEAYEQFNIGNIEVVFNPDTYECLYSIPSADVKDKKINLTKIPTVDTPYDTNTIIKDYIETRFGRIPSEEQVKNQNNIEKEQPSKEIPVKEPNTEVTTGEEISVSEKPVEEAELPDEPGDEIDTGIDLDNSDENIDQETEEAQAETGSAVFYKVRPNQHSSIEDVREKSLDGDTPQSNYIVVDTIDLAPEQFNDFISDFSKPQSFLTGIQSLDRKNYSFNVVKITSSAADYTLLVDPLGYDYARYISIIDKLGDD